MIAGKIGGKKKKEGNLVIVLMTNLKLCHWAVR